MSTPPANVWKFSMRSTSQTVLNFKTNHGQIIKDRADKTRSLIDAFLDDGGADLSASSTESVSTESSSSFGVSPWQKYTSFQVIYSVMVRKLVILYRSQVHVNSGIEFLCIHF